MSFKKTIKIMLILTIAILILGTTATAKNTPEKFIVPDTQITTPHNKDVSRTITIKKPDQEENTQTTDSTIQKNREKNYLIHIQQPTNNQGEQIKTIKEQIYNDEEEVPDKNYEEETIKFKIKSYLSKNTRPGTYTGKIIIYTAEETTKVGEGALIIEATNTAPIITTYQEIKITKDRPATHQIQAEDNEEDDITFTLNKGNDKAELSETGILTINTNSEETFDVEIEATDTYGKSSKKTIQIKTANNEEIPTDKEEINIGGANQKRNEQIIQEIIITNPTNKKYLNIDAKILNREGTELEEKYGAQTTIAKNTLSPEESTTIQVKINIPKDKNSKKELIGKLVIKAEKEIIATETPTNTENKLNLETIQKEIPITMEAKSYLSIDRVEIEFLNRNKDSEKISNGEKFDELEEGDEIRVTVTLENKYNDKELEDAYFKIEADENDWDIDDESNDHDINEDDKEKLELEFTLDDIEEEKTNVIIKAFATDKENKFEHHDQLSFELEIEELESIIKIKDIDVDKTISCDERYLDIEVEIENTGSDDENRAAIKVESKHNELNFEEIKEDIEIDEGDEITESFNLRLPSNLDEGDYKIEVTTYYDDDEKSDSETINIYVECSYSGNDYDNNPAYQNDNNKKSEDIASGIQFLNQPVNTETGTSEKTDDTIIILAIAGILVFLGIIGLTIYLVRN